MATSKDKILGYNISIQSPFLSYKIQSLKFEVKSIVLLPISTPKKKYLSTNLMKYILDLYEENYKITMNKIKEQLNNEDIPPCSWVGRHYIVKMLVLPNFLTNLFTYGLWQMKTNETVGRKQQDLVPFSIIILLRFLSIHTILFTLKQNETTSSTSSDSHIKLAS